jgi:hypothetical protein
MFLLQNIISLNSLSRLRFKTAYYSYLFCFDCTPSFLNYRGHLYVQSCASFCTVGLLPTSIGLGCAATQQER